MNPLDIGVIAVIGLSAVFAFARGFVREALSIVAWIGAGLITLYGWGPVYAMVDLHRDRLNCANLISVPGCYPTAALLACVPALRAGLIEPDIVVDAKSGVSGAGRAATLGNSFSEVNESVHAYGVEGHRHKSEMLEQLGDAAGGDVRFTFVPHLIPMTRGILATAYLRPNAGVTAAQLHDLYASFCATSPFLDLVAAPPATKSVTGTNRAAIHVGWQDGVAVVNLLPGPASTQLAIYCAWRLRGAAGALIGGALAAPYAYPYPYGYYAGYYAAPPYGGPCVWRRVWNGYGWVRACV